MINKIAISQPRPFPISLRYTEIRTYILAGLFVLFGVLTPWVFHQFHLAGATFLPMHLFVFAGALLFGWRLGLMVGLLSPLVSYALSGMPALQTLPQIIVELSTYGLVAGVLREKLHLRAAWSLLGAMAAGRLALGLVAVATFLTIGKVYSPFGLADNPLSMVWSVIKQGWPGMVLQLTLIPGVIWLAAELRKRQQAK